MTTIKLNLNDLINSANSHGIVEIDVTMKSAKQHKIAFILSADDVTDVRPDLTKEQAWEVLQAVAEDDTIFWDTLQFYTDYLFPDNKIGDK